VWQTYRQTDEQATDTLVTIARIAEAMSPKNYKNDWKSGKQHQKLQFQANKISNMEVKYCKDYATVISQSVMTSKLAQNCISETCCCFYYCHNFKVQHSVMINKTLFNAVLLHIKQYNILLSKRVRNKLECMLARRYNRLNWVQLQIQVDNAVTTRQYTEINTLAAATKSKLCRCNHIYEADLALAVGDCQKIR